MSLSTTPFPAAPLLMAPDFAVRPWGGHLLRDRFGKPIPQDDQVGESWELSDHPNGKSRIAGGPFDGVEFGDLLRRHPREMIGHDTAPHHYPLLIKIIDAAEDLSIQVHPDDEYAQQRLGQEHGKTECWYVIDCAPDTEVIWGIQNGYNADDLRRGAADGSIESMVARHPLAPDSFLFVSAGTIHAILKGTLICEIQKSSDTTYRLWDWKRQPARELHVERSLEVIDWGHDAEGGPVSVPATGTLDAPHVLTDNPYFRVRAYDVPPGESRALPGDLATSGVVVVVLHGIAQLASRDGAVELPTASTAFLPAICEGKGTLTATGDQALRVLLVESREL